MTDDAAVILVGGKSLRMGRDKASLPYKGMRLIDVVAAVIRAAGIEQLYVSGEMKGYDSLPDLLTERGPVGGICSSAVRLYQKHPQVLFIPVDLPHLNTALLQALLSNGHRARCFDGHPLPCLLPLDKKTMRQVDTAAQILARKQKLSVASFLTMLDAENIAVPPLLENALTNTNTPEEWQEATDESTHH